MANGSDLPSITFIIGTGRCGSTVLHELLCYHPQASWITRMASEYPTNPLPNRIAGNLWQMAPNVTLFKKAGKPTEAWGFWRHYFPGFPEPCRDLFARDVTDRMRQRIHRAFRTMFPQGKHAIVKLTGWPRIGFLQEIFPDANYIHIVRDGRAVANSVVNIGFWSGWRGPTHWRWGELTDEQQAEWEQWDRSYAALAGIQWKIIVDATEAARELVSEDKFMELTFEESADHTAEALARCWNFCGMDNAEQVAHQVAARRTPRNTNLKWRENLSEFDQEALSAVLHDHLVKYGYDVEE